MKANSKSIVFDVCVAALVTSAMLFGAGKALSTYGEPIGGVDQRVVIGRVMCSGLGKCAAPKAMTVTQGNR